MVELKYELSSILCSRESGFASQYLTEVTQSPIGLITVFDAIWTSRQPRAKLQCLYENLISHNFRKTAVMKKYEL